MESSAKRINLQDALSHCSKQARKVKNLVKRAKSFAHQAETQAEKVDLLSGETAISLCAGVEEIFEKEEECKDDSTNEIEVKLKKVLAITKRCEPPESKDANDEKQEGVKMLKTHPSSLVDPKLPTLPVYCGCGYASSEGTSDTESEFFPDWSSADSAASDRCQDDIRLGESSDQFLWPDHIGGFYGDEDILRLSEEEFDDLFEDERDDLPCGVDVHPLLPAEKSRILESTPGINDPDYNVIMPAAGNDEPGTSQQLETCEKVLDPVDGKEHACPTDVKPQAIRRVKSMIIDNDLNDSVEVAARMLALQQKQRSNDGMGMSPPSPLLSSEDVSFVKKSPSQMSARFTMKRSRSNISVGLAQLKKGDVASAKAAEREVIHEEEEGT